VLDVDGAGVMLVSDEERTPLCSSDAAAARIEELWFTLGEGPGVDAHSEGVPVGEPDLASPRHPRWPSFSPLAVDAGAGAIFAFPLRLGGVHLGALSLYQRDPGDLSDEQHRDALTMATIVLTVVLAHQANAPPGALAVELDTFTATVHQASGMVAVQLHVSLSEALVRLRAHAYREDRPLADIARDVVGRRLRLSR
jgi:hypothetical protein